MQPPQKSPPFKNTKKYLYIMFIKQNLDTIFLHKSDNLIQLKLNWNEHNSLNLFNTQILTL